MNKLVIFTLMILLSASFSYGQYLPVLKTNGLDVYAYPSRTPAEREWQFLAEAYSNEVRLLSGYIQIGNHDLLNESLQMIIESKKYHISLIGEIHRKYDHDNIPSAPGAIAKATNSVKIRDTCKAKVQEELENKMFYEKHLYQSGNEDIKKVFGLIANNSETTFKILQYHIPKLK